MSSNLPSCLKPPRPVVLPILCPTCKGRGGEWARGGGVMTYGQWLECRGCDGYGTTPPWRFFTKASYELTLSLAQAAYEERNPDGTLETDRLLVLSDVLEEAGCDSDDLLMHLRSPGPHVRGCWAVDLILGKE